MANAVTGISKLINFVGLKLINKSPPTANLKTYEVTRNVKYRALFAVRKSSNCVEKNAETQQNLFLGQKLNYSGNDFTFLSCVITAGCADVARRFDELTNSSTADRQVCERMTVSKTKVRLRKGQQGCCSCTAPLHSSENSSAH